jgi:hypothetical protein
MSRRRSAVWALAPLILQAGAGFDPVRDVPVALAGGVLSLTIPPGAHLKVETFRIVLGSRGTLHLGPLPPATDQDDAGDPIWRGTLRVALKGSGLEDPVKLVVTYQPCTEGPDAVCYLPVKRALTASVAEVPVETP